MSQWNARRASFADSVFGAGFAVGRIFVRGSRDLSTKRKDLRTCVADRPCPSLQGIEPKLFCIPIYLKTIILYSKTLSYTCFFLLFP